MSERDCVFSLYCSVRSWTTRLTDTNGRNPSLFHPNPIPSHPTQSIKPNQSPHPTQTITAPHPVSNPSFAWLRDLAVREGAHLAAARALRAFPTDSAINHHGLFVVAQACG